MIRRKCVSLLGAPLALRLVAPLSLASAVFLAGCVKEVDPWEKTASPPQAPESLFGTPAPLKTPKPMEQMTWDEKFQEGSRAAQDKDFDRAEPLLTAAFKEVEPLGGKDPRFFQTLKELAYMYYLGMNKFTEAEPLFKRLAEEREKVLGPDEPEVAYDMLAVANLLSFLNRFDEAEPIFKDAIERLERNLSNHPDRGKVYLQRTLQGYADMLKRAKRDAESDQILARMQRVAQ